MDFFNLLRSGATEWGPHFLASCVADFSHATHMCAYPSTAIPYVSPKTPMFFFTHEDAAGLRPDGASRSERSWEAFRRGHLRVAEREGCAAVIGDELMFRAMLTCWWNRKGKCSIISSSTKSQKNRRS